MEKGHGQTLTMKMYVNAAMLVPATRDEQDAVHPIWKVGVNKLILRGQLQEFEDYWKVWVLNINKNWKDYFVRRLCSQFRRQ